MSMKLSPSLSLIISSCTFCIFLRFLIIYLPIILGIISSSWDFSRLLDDERFLFSDYLRGIKYCLTW
jgi:hypothetical protein